MNQCAFCSYGSGSHDPNCPNRPGVKNQRAALQSWHRGFADGRNARPRTEQDPMYMMGWLKGEIALETYENSESDR